MKRSTILIILLLVLLPTISFGNNAIPDDVYKKVHADACSAVAAPHCPSLTDENEKFAFVMTWCDRHPEAPACGAVKGVTSGPAVIAFNHDTQVWRPVYGLTEDEIKFDKDGVPKVLTSSGRTVVAVVESTDPLLYQAVAGSLTEADAAVIKDIQKVFDALGPKAQGLVGLAAGILPQADIDAARTVVMNLKCATDHWTEASQFADRVERHRAGKYQLVENECHVSKDTLPTELAKLEKLNCVTEATKLKDALSMTDKPDDMLAKANAINIGPQCTVFEPVRQRTALFAQKIKAAAGDTPVITAIGKLAKDELTRVTDAIDIMTPLVAPLAADNRSKIEDLLDKLDDFEQRLIAALAAPQPKTGQIIDTSEVADVIVVPKGTIVVSPDKDRSRTLTVSKASPFDPPLTKRPDSVSSSYSTESLYLSLIDVTAAMTFTGLTAPEFGTVTAPAPTTEHPDATKLVIAKKNEKRRSGKVAAFVEFPILSKGGVPVRRLVGALGVGTDSDTSAIFAGLSFRATSALHIGGGVTWQSVKALDAQKLGDTVGAATDIKLKDAREHSWYVSFSFSLGSLSLFKGL
jgi:hypothetical protein